MLFNRLSPSAPRAGDNAWLDLLRALAIVLVLLRHGYVATTPSDTATGFFGFLALNGWIGVDLFFVLSGYLISRHLMRSGLGTSGFSWPRYLATRALRIVPAYLVVLILILLTAFPLYRIATDDLAFRMAYHLLFFQDYLPANINVAFWSLGVEEKFYLLAPFVLWLVLTRKTPQRVVLALGILFVLPFAIRCATFMFQEMPMDYGAFFRRLRSPFHASLDPLVIGIALAVIERAGARIGVKAATATLVLSAATLLAWIGSHDFMAEISFFDATAQPTFVAILCGCMVFAAINLRSQRLPLDPAIRLLARLSYSLYLVHLPLIPLVRALAWTVSDSVIAFWPIYLGLCLFAAGILYSAVERPFLRLKDEINRRPTNPATVQHPQAIPAPHQ